MVDPDENEHMISNDQRALHFEKKTKTLNSEDGLGRGGQVSIQLIHGSCSSGWIACPKSTWDQGTSNRLVTGQYLRFRRRIPWQSFNCLNQLLSRQYHTSDQGFLCFPQ